MDFFSSGSEGVTGLCRWQLRRARSQFLCQSTKISSQEHWLQSFGKANWIVLYFSDSSPSGAPKAGALPETHHNIGGRRSVGAFSPCAFSLSQRHGEHRGVSAFPLRLSSVPLCLCERPTPSRLHGRDDHAPLPSCSSCHPEILTLIRVGALTSPSVFEISSQFRHTPPSVHASARSVPPQIFQESS
jgi:hypothetical protein